MGCGDEKLSKYLTQTFTAHRNALICQQVTLSGDAEWPKVADAVIEAEISPSSLILSTRPNRDAAMAAEARPPSIFSGWRAARSGECKIAPNASKCASVS